MYLYNIIGQSSLTSLGLMAATSHSDALVHLDIADEILAEPDFDVPFFQETVEPLRAVDIIRPQALETHQLAQRYLTELPEQAQIRARLGELLVEMRGAVTEANETPANDNAAVSDNSAAGVQRGVVQLFGARSGRDITPSEERLPQIQQHIEKHLAYVDQVLERLGRVAVFGKVPSTTLERAARELLDKVEAELRLRGDVGRQLAQLSVDTAVHLSEQVSHLYLRVQSLEEAIAQDEQLGTVYRSEIVDSDWALRGPVLDENAATELPGLNDFFASHGIQPGSQSRIETLLQQYVAYLRDKKGGEIGPIQDQAFDSQVMATVMTAPVDTEVVTVALNFIQTVWGRSTPTYDEILVEHERITSEHAKLRAERQPLFPEHYEILQAEAGDTLRDYLKRLGFRSTRNDSVRELIGVHPRTVMRWGTKKEQHTVTPGEIGRMITLYHYLVEEAWRQDTLYGQSQGTVILPDPMELLRLAYGTWAKDFFKGVAGDDAWTVVVPVPGTIFDLSYAEMFYGRVLQKYWDAHHYRTTQVAQGAREIFEEAVTSGTLRRHLNGEVMPHRRYDKTRETLRLIFGDGGDSFDFFLEAKAIIDQVVNVTLPGERRLSPPNGSRSNWQVRLVPRDSEAMDFTAVNAHLDATTHPFKYLEGGRDDFTLLLAELRDRLSFIETVQGRDSRETIELAHGETRSLKELGRTLSEFEKKHQIMLARLEHYRAHPEKTPFSAAQRYEQFYRRVLLFARSIRQFLPITGTFSLPGQEISYQVVEPVAGQAALSTHFKDNGSAVVSCAPGHYMALVAGEELSAELASDLFQLRIASVVMQKRGLLTESTRPQFIRRLFPQHEATTHERLLNLLHQWEQIESSAAEVSVLGSENSDVVALYERADRLTARSLEMDLEKWLPKRLEEFLWNRFGLPYRDKADYLAVLKAYFHHHPEFATEFNTTLFESAFETHGAGNGRIKGLLLEFLLFVGLPVSEAVAETRRHRMTRLPSVLRMPPRSTEAELPKLPVYPTRQEAFATDFLIAQNVPARWHPGLTVLMARLYEEPDQPEQIATELSSTLGLELPEEAELAPILAAWQERRQVIEDVIDRAAAHISNSLPRAVGRGFLQHQAFAGAPTELAPLILRILAPRLSQVSPASNAFRRSAELIPAWQREERQRAERTQGDLLGLLDWIADETVENRSDFWAQLFEIGHEAVPELMQNVKDPDDWLQLMDRHEINMTLFAADNAVAVRSRFNALIDALPDAPPTSGASISATRPEQAPHAAKAAKLPSARWDPELLCFMSPEEHRRFWQALRDRLAPVDRLNLIFYLDSNGIQVARVSDIDRERVFDFNDEMESENGVIQFHDIDSGESHTIQRVQVRLNLQGGRDVKGMIDWLAAVDPSHPSYIDAQAVQALAFFLPLTEQAKAEFLTLSQIMMQQRQPELIRTALNNYMDEHGSRLRRYRTYWENMGPWHLTGRTRIRIEELASQKAPTAQRFQKVYEMLERSPGLPEEVRIPLQTAIRELMALEEPAEADYHRTIETFLGFWDFALARDAERMAALLPSRHQDMAYAPELNRTHNLHLSIAQFEIRQTLGHLRNQDPEQRDKEVLHYYSTLKRVFETPELEPLQRMLRIVLYVLLPINRFGNPIVDPLLRLFQKRSSFLFNPKKRRRGLKDFFDFYKKHRNEFLWRLREKQEQLPWATDLLPRVLPPRYELSAEFPELEELSFAELDHFRLHERSLKRVPDSMMILRIDRDGLWQQLLIPPDQFIVEKLPGLDHPIAIGLSNGKTHEDFRATYFVTMLTGYCQKLEREALQFIQARKPTKAHKNRVAAQNLRLKLQLIPSGGDETIRIQDIFGTPLELSGNEVDETISIAQHLYSGSATITDALSAVFADIHLQDIHPLLTLMFGTPRTILLGEQRQGLAESYIQIFRVAQVIKDKIAEMDRQKGPQQREQLRQEIREAVIGTYRRGLADMHATLSRGRFTPYLEP